ncbi:hypothetical protein J2T13_002003 [Paenibacillus sp. DS2015]|uniref:hypothetical protein n=1 Tax=Paenibacillus sp. DS2015 TaxID=3373917 RepID=UPI003D1A97F9
MSENAQNMIFLSVSLVVFVSASWITLNMLRQMDHTLQAVSAANQGQSQSIQVTLRTSSSEVYSGSQVLYSLSESKRIGIIVEVDGYIFDSAEILETDYNRIDVQQMYSVGYIRDGSGNIIRLIFTGLKGTSI